MPRGEKPIEQHDSREKQRRTALEELFKNCDSAFVFNQVKRQLDSGGTRSLWRKIESEMQDSGVGAADTYIRSVFSELAQQLRDSLSHLKESLGE